MRHVKTRVAAAALTAVALMGVNQNGKPVAEAASSPSCSLPEMPEAPQDANFKFLTWNIQQLPAIATQAYPKGRENCQRELAQKFDVAVLQEAFVNGPTLEKNAAWSWRPVFKAGNNVLGFLNEGFRSPGLLASAGEGRAAEPVLARSFKSCAGLFNRKNDCFAEKGFQMFRVGQVTFVNLHMDAGGDITDSKTRTQQLAKLFEALPKQGRLVLAGDFNIKQKNAVENTAFEDLLAKHNLRIALHEETDVIAVRGEGIEVAKSGILPLSLYSDHDGLYAYLKIRPDLLHSPPLPALQLARLDRK